MRKHGAAGALKQYKTALPVKVRSHTAAPVFRYAEKLTFSRVVAHAMGSVCWVHNVLSACLDGFGEHLIDNLHGATRDNGLFGLL